ncbi:serine/threonine protein kinase [Mesorhizobium sp. LNHC220B00]|nr:serine/threonine-protein kinase [Mesorhizobium sp. LNHC220B00]ESY80710.1 serine/threonine protein kinase [Mesorhizobium sp. LNHC220B00]
MASYEQTRIHSTNRFDPGVRLNDTYQLDERIASGGMGDVYRGHNIETGEPVAIKTVRPELVGDEIVFELFRKEGTILGRLNHPTIVRYYSFSRDPKIGRPYLVMEFVEGQSLAERIKAGPLSLEETRQLFGPVADGLALAHKAGVIHRDLSPDNIILQHGNIADPKIIDFGIARAANSGEHTILGGSFAGKFSFVSPEQLGLLGRQVTNRSDIYSMGLVMAAALRGKPLDMGSFPADVIEKRGTVPDLIDIDISLRPLLEAMLQPDPENRPGSMAQIANWLKLPPDAASLEATIPRIFGQPAQDLQAEAEKRASPVNAATIEVPTPPTAQRRAAEPTGRPTSANPQFVEHVSPVLQGRTIFKAKKSEAAAKSISGTNPSRTSLIAGVFLVLTAVTGTGAYFTGLIDFPGGVADRTVNGDQSSGTDAGGSDPINGSQSSDKIQTHLPSPSLARPPDSNAQADQHSTPTSTEASTAKQPGTSAQADQKSTASAAKQDGGTQPKHDDTAIHVDRTLAKSQAEHDSEPHGVEEGDPGKLRAMLPSAGKAGDAKSKSDTVASAKKADTASQPSVAPNKETTPDEANSTSAPNPDECFFASITAQSDDAMAIKGVGLSVAPFDRIKTALASSGSGDARIDGHIVTARQCPVTAFLKTIHDTTSDNPSLNFSNLNSPVTGTVTNVGARVLRLFAVDGKGTVFDLQNDTISANTPALFKLTFDGARANFAPPGIIIALTSGGPIDLGRAGTTASGLPALADTLAASGDVTGIDFGFFPYGGEESSSAQ